MPRLTSARVACLLAGLLPLVAYVVSASGHGYWLDSGELLAAAVWLDIAHPPGHPLASLWGKAFSLVPIGPLPFRVAVGQGVALALSLGFVQVAGARTLRALGLARAPAAWLGLLAAWLVGFAYGAWFQAVRVEVYALAALPVCISLERATCVLAPRDDDEEGEGDVTRSVDARPLLQAALALGLGLTNHHFIALLALPALIVPLVWVVRAHGVRVALTALGLGVLGLSVYVYLPLRAATLPPMDLGHPVTWRDLAWVVSARVYARHIGSEASEPLGTRLADLAVLIVENLGAFTVLFALLGGYALCRARARLPIASLWAITALVSLIGRAWLNPVRDNPDVLGYMLPGFAALAVLAAVGVGALLTSLPARLAGPRALAVLSFGAACGVGLLASADGAARSALARFHATTTFDDARLTALPPRALVVLSTPGAAFRHWEAEAVSALRADVTLVPLPFLGYGATASVLRARTPAIAPLLDDLARSGVLAADRLGQLAATRPVYVELDPGLVGPLASGLVPDGLLYAVQPRRGAIAEAAAQGQQMPLARIEASADAGERETRKQLLWSWYVAALYWTARGERARALASAEQGLRVLPGARELVRLKAALEAGRTPDLRAFVPERAR